MKNIRISVFTPAYNRGYIIEKLYSTLSNQTFKNFEWIVINDGSTDHTHDLMQKIISQEHFFSIRYLYKQNGGKHRAINDGVKLAKGKLFFIVDSDDYLTEDALEKIDKWEKTIPIENNYAGVAGLRSDFTGKIIGEYPMGEKYSKYIDSTNLDRKKNKLKGDKAEAYYTSILKRYPFPEISDEKFLTEAVVWNKIASDGYLIRWFNEIIYKCEYLEDGLTRNSDTLFKSSPNGWRYYYNQQSKIDKKFINRVYYASRYIQYSIYLNKPVFKDAQNRLLSVLAYPIGVYYFVKSNKLK